MSSCPIDAASEQEEFNLNLAMQKHREQAKQTLGVMSAMECVECGNEIPEARRRAIQGVQRCVVCAGIFERKHCR